jgi:hypothetical protein
MNIADALYEFARTEIVPMVAGESELTAGLLNGVLRASRKKININIAGNSMLKAIGIVKDNGELDAESLKDFFDGVFEGKEMLPVSLADLLKATTGISSDNELLQDKLKFTRGDAERLLSLLGK